MDIFTESQKATSRGRELTISPFGELRHSPSRLRHRPKPARFSGAAPLRDPRGDLQMFDLRPSALSPRVASDDRVYVAPAGGDAILDRVTHSGSGLKRPPAAPVSAAMDERLVAHSVERETPRVRLTTRGYKVLLGVAAGVVVLCSALTVGSGDVESPVAEVEVVARGGESVEAIAERTAGGRDVVDVAQLIRSANGIEAGESLRAGDVVLVPGS